MRTSRTGYVYAIAAYAIWGLFPLYWRLLRPATALEILAHRTVWSLVFMLGVIAVLRTWRRLGGLLRRKTLVPIGVAAVILGINWCTFVYAVNADRVVETSLGYFICPLVSVLLGVFVLREGLTTPQWVAVGIGALAVGVLTIDYGHIPWVALVLAITFGSYGLVKKRLQVPAADGLAVESGILALPAAGYLLVLSALGESTLGTVSVLHTVLLIASGLITAVPLLLFAGATNRIPLTAVGLLQYLTPILQFACGVLLLHEPMPRARLFGFGLVWLALIIFTWDGLRRAAAGAGNRAEQSTLTASPSTR